MLWLWYIYIYMCVSVFVSVEEKAAITMVYVCVFVSEYVWVYNYVFVSVEGKAAITMMKVVDVCVSRRHCGSLCWKPSWLLNERWKRSQKRAIWTVSSCLLVLVFCAYCTRSHWLVWGCLVALICTLVSTKQTTCDESDGFYLILKCDLESQ